jgi:hypothetical protein
MHLASGIEKFVVVVSHCSEPYEVLKEIQSLSTTRDDQCPTISGFALHLIPDLYDESSSLEANINRIPLNSALPSTREVICFTSYKKDDAALNAVASVEPEWLRGVAKPGWFERHSHRFSHPPRNDSFSSSRCFYYRKYSLSSF